MVYRFGTSLDKARKPEGQIPGTTSTSRRIQEYQKRGDNCAMDLADMIKSKYRGLECQGCLCFMGYQHRFDPSIVVCSGVCLLEVDQKIQAHKQAAEQQQPQQQANAFACKGTCGLANPPMFPMPPQPFMQPSLMGAPPGMQLMPIPNPYGLPGVSYVYVPNGFVPAIPPPMVHPHQQTIKSEHPNLARRYHKSTSGDSGNSPTASGSTDHSPTISSSQVSNGQQRRPVDSSTPQSVEHQNGYAETSSSTMGSSPDDSLIVFKSRPNEKVIPAVDLTEPKLVDYKVEEEQVKTVLDRNDKPPSVEIPELEETATPVTADLLHVARVVKESATLATEGQSAMRPFATQPPISMQAETIDQMKAPVDVARPKAEADAPLAVIQSPKDFNETSMAAPSFSNREPATSTKPGNKHIPTKPEVKQQQPEFAQNVKTQGAKKSFTINKNLLSNIVLSTSLYDRAECYWHYMWTPTKFTLTAIQDSEKMEEMAVKMADYCATAPSMTEMPMVGEIVYAPYDGTYYRGVVMKRNKEKKVLKVEFVDYGDSAELSLEDCKEPSVDINYPIFGVTLHLTCDQMCPLEMEQEIITAIETTFTPPVFIHLEKQKDEFNWFGEIYPSTNSDATISQFVSNYIRKNQPVQEEKPEQVIGSPSAVSTKANKKLEDETSAANCSKLESDTESVSSKKRQVFKKNKDGDSVSVVSAQYDELSNKKTVQSLESSTAKACKPRLDSGLKSTVNSKQQPQSGDITAEVPSPLKPSVSKRSKSPDAVKHKKLPDAVKPSKSSDVSISKNPAKLSSFLVQDAEFSEALKHSALVRINYMFTLGRLLVYAVSDENNLKELQLEIENNAPKAPGLSRMPVVNEILIAPYQNVYYRGKVVSFDEQYAVIRFLDYGDQEKVAITEIKELPDSIRKFPIYGLELHMVGVPDDMTFFDSKLVATIYEMEAQLQLLTKLEPGVFKARLWYGLKDDAHWASIVNSEYADHRLNQAEAPK